MKVIVIGCGPAGLAAAHAAVGQYCEVSIYANAQKTTQYGALLLQRPIPGINQDHPDFTLRQIVVGGSILDYRYKLYGDVNIGINGDILREWTAGWDHRATYDKMWDIYGDQVISHWVSGDELASLHKEADLVVSTANAQALCMNRMHQFIGQPIAVTSGTAYREDQPDNLTVFSAREEDAWVRSAHIGGHRSTEWPIEKAPARAKIITKPISTDCDCFPHVYRTGRYGAWRNETWVDTAYYETFGIIGNMKRAKELD